MYNHNKAQQSKNRVHISWDILYNDISHDTKPLDISGFIITELWVCYGAYCRVSVNKKFLVHPPNSFNLELRIISLITRFMGQHVGPMNFVIWVDTYWAIRILDNASFLAWFQTKTYNSLNFELLWNLVFCFASYASVSTIFWTVEISAE